MCETYHRRIADLENKKFDLEKEVEFRDFQVENGGHDEIMHLRRITSHTSYFRAFCTTFVTSKKYFLAILCKRHN